MGTKQTPVETTFEERTQELQPWLGTQGVDDTRPDPQVAQPKVVQAKEATKKTNKKGKK